MICCMDKESYTIYTDASFDCLTKTGVYSVIIMKENIIIKTIAKKCRIPISNSTECEIFAIYQAINIILSNYIKKEKMQKFKVETDCVAAKDFFTEKTQKISVFQNNIEFCKIMRKLYKKLLSKLCRKGCSFTLSWFSRENNKIAHKYSYSLFQKLKIVGNEKDVIIIDKNIFFEILSNYNKKQCEVLCYLIQVANEQKIIDKTQKEIAKILNLSTSVINKIFKELINLNVLGKMKNGKYVLEI